jgi:hypothetical protein
MIIERSHCFIFRCRFILFLAIRVCSRTSQLRTRTPPNQSVMGDGVLDTSRLVSLHVEAVERRELPATIVFGIQ